MLHLNNHNWDYDERNTQSFLSYTVEGKQLTNYLMKNI